jgi:hypothetical protein
MVPRICFINKIREVGYTYKTKQKRTTLWRKRGGTHCIFVPLAELLEDDYVANALTQAGLTQADIQAFMASAKS